MIKSFYDVVIIGAGPAGITAAHYLSESKDRSILLIELGNHHSKRECPVEYGNYCNGCNGNCNVISGFGGCIHYSDGVKLSLMPCARRLIRLFGKENAFDLSNRVFSFIQELMKQELTLSGTNIPEKTIEFFLEQNLSIREYPVAVVSESLTRKVINKFFNEISNDEYIDLLLESEVIEVNKLNGMYEIGFLRKRQLRNVATNHVLFATGRRGIISTKCHLESLGLSLTPPQASYGIRFVMRASLLREIGLIHPDLKISKRFSMDEKVKTFCFCGGLNGGIIKFTKYMNVFNNQIITLDGNKTVDRNENNKELSANFALLAQCPESVKESYTWLNHIFIPKYLQLTSGKPIIQPLQDFSERRDTKSSLEDIKNSMPFDFQIKDLVVGPLFELFDNQIHSNIISMFVEIMKAILRIKELNYDLTKLYDEVIVVGPELEFLWHKVKLDSNCQTSIKGCYVIGDAAGYSQGIIPAMMMGLAAARKILTNSN